jgi:hypothetical protein
MDWGTVIGVVVGAGAGVAGTYLQQRTALKREELAFSRRRQQAARDFERDNLIALRDAIAAAQEVVHETGELWHQYRGDASRFERPAELRQRIAQCQTSIAKYSECSRNETVRANGMAVRKALLSGSAEGSVAPTVFEPLEEAAATAYRSIGDQLQALRDEELRS